MQRLAKAISHAGIASRRDAEILIKNNEVKVDGAIVNSPATLVDTRNTIEVRGQLINMEQDVRLWRYYKPVGLINTHKDTHGRRTIFDNLKELNLNSRVISIGRLDLNSEGLLLLTNNGTYSRKFELPSSKIKRIYKVRAYGKYDLLLKNCKDKASIEIDQICYNIESVKLLHSTKSNSWFEVVLTEGKNREIRRVFEYFGLNVNRLIRVQYGDFILGDLKPSEYEEVKLDKLMKFYD